MSFLCLSVLCGSAVKEAGKVHNFAFDYSYNSFVPRDAPDFAS